MVDESLLREPADRCMRLVALSLLADAQKAGDRLMSVSQELRSGDVSRRSPMPRVRPATRQYTSRGCARNGPR